MILIAISAAAITVLTLWVLAPLLWGAAATEPPADDTVADLIETKHAVYRSILDLENDHMMGKVSDEDYGVMRRQHEVEAVRILRSLEEAPDREVDLLESEIAEARRRLSQRRGT